MASRYRPHRHSHHCQHHAPLPSTHCCRNPSYSCCSPPPPQPPPSPDQLVQAIASLLSQSDPIPTHLYSHFPNLFSQYQHQYQKYHPPPTHKHQHQQQPQHQQQTHSTIASLLCRIEDLESSLHHFSPLRDTAARVIQTHFRAFLVRRSRTLRHLKHLALIKSTFSALKSSFSNDTYLDFAALSHKAMDLLLHLNSIEDGDSMITEGKRSIRRDLVKFLDSIEGVAVKRHCRYVKAAKNARFGRKLNNSRALESKYGNSSGDYKSRRKLLQNLGGRVEKISRLCKVSANDEDSGIESIRHVGDDDNDEDPSVVVTNRRNGDGVSPNKNGVFVQRQGLQSRVKKNVSFAENGNISKAYGSSTYEPDLSEDVSCLDGSSSSDGQGEILLGNVICEVEDAMGSPHGAEDDEEALVHNGGSPHSSDGERN